MEVTNSESGRSKLTTPPGYTPGTSPEDVESTGSSKFGGHPCDESGMAAPKAAKEY